jgi:signal transduction histidine kinase
MEHSIDSERELREQNERLEEFARMVSHDLRNPLNVAQGRLALAREECDSEHLVAVDRAHERMGALIDDLLALSQKGEHGRETEPVALAETVEECWQTVETESATFSVDTDRTILADRSRFKRLLENLIRNAIQHGGHNVAVMIGDLTDGFYVEDDGPGIPESERKLVFESGYSTSSDGIGLGLLIVEQVVDTHGWTIRVREGAFGGARFEVTGVDMDP